MLQLIPLVFVFTCLVGLGTISQNSTQTWNPISNDLIFTIWKVVSIISMFIMFSLWLENNTNLIIKIFFIDLFDYKLFKLLLALVHIFYLGFIDSTRTSEIYGNIFLFAISDSFEQFINTVFRGFIFFDLFEPFVVITYNNIILGKSSDQTSKYIKIISYGSQLLGIIYFLNIGLMIFKHNFI